LVYGDEPATGDLLTLQAYMAVAQSMCCPGQLSLLPLAGWKMSTGQSAVMLCSWGVKAGWLNPLVDKRVSGK